MKTNLKLLIVIAMVVVCGSLLTPKSGFGAENRNSVASISTLEMGHFSKENGVVKWIPKKQPKVHKVDGSTAFSSDPLVNQQIQFGLFDAKIIKCLEGSVSGTSVESTFSNTDFVDLQRSCRCIEARVKHLLNAESHSIPDRSVDNLLALQRACRFMDTGVGNLLNVRAPFLQNENPQPSPKRKSIVILYVSDVHCEVFGYPIMAGYQDAISDTAYVATVEVGDFLQGGIVGSISKGSHIVLIIRNMNHDAVALGNHEPDFGMQRQHDLMDSINAPVVCANFYDMEGKCIYSPYVIKSYGDRKVAYVGVLTAYTEEIKSSEFYTADGQKIYDLRREEMVQIVQQSVNDARAEGADYVVLLSHVGDIIQDRSCPTSKDLVAATTGIDVVIDGHSHKIVQCDTVLNSAGQPVYITQTGKKFANIGKLVISPNGHISIELIPTKSIPYRNARVAHITDSINALVNASTAYTVFYTDYELTINDENGVKAETNAGDIVVDAMRWGLKTDMAFVNDGGLREGIESGEVSYRQVCDLALFHDNVVKIQASGSEILEMLHRCTQNLQNDDEFPQVSGMKFSVRVSDHTITSAEVLQSDGSYIPIDPAAIYTVAILEYATHTGFHKTFTKCRPVLENSGILYRDMLVDYIKEVYGGKVPSQYAKPQGRITIE